MWSTENRRCYDRSKLGYRTDLTDAEWALVEPLILPAKRGGNKRTLNMGEVVNGLMHILMHILGTGCRWAAIPKSLPTGLTRGTWPRAARCMTALPAGTGPAGTGMARSHACITRFTFNAASSASRAAKSPGPGARPAPPWASSAARASGRPGRQER